jgi:GTP-binding protein
LISSPRDTRLPRVAILGRPNVGKSTLFNALIGRRRSITHSAPGVTRDPVEVECAFAGRRLLLIDTGGYTADGDSMGRLVSERSLGQADRADLLILVLEAGGTNTEDESYIELLRPKADKLILAVNKIDTPDRDALVWNFHRYGFANVIGVSAAHNRNLEELRDLVAALLEDASPEGESGARGGEALGDAGRGTVRVAILGKPNSGKSSLSNLLLGEQKSIVSELPGTTRDVVEGSFVFKNALFRVLDTAGIRRRTRVHDSIEYYSVSRALESVRGADVVFLLVDAAEGLSDQDKKIAAYAVEQGRGILLVLNKWDRQPKGRGHVESAREKVRFQFPVLDFAPILPVSSLTGAGVRELLETALQIVSQLNTRVATGRLNQALTGWVAHYPLPVRGKNFKIRFATQVSVNPVRFVVFVNRLAGFPTAYSQYLSNCIRRDLGFSGVPVGLEFRKSRKPGR